MNVLKNGTKLKFFVRLSKINFLNLAEKQRRTCNLYSIQSRMT